MQRKIQSKRVKLLLIKAKFNLGMKLKLTTYPIGKDDEGTEAIAFGYEPV